MINWADRKWIGSGSSWWRTNAGKKKGKKDDRAKRKRGNSRVKGKSGEKMRKYKKVIKKSIFVGLKKTKANKI